MGSHNKPGRDTIYESIFKKILLTDGKMPSLDQIEFTEAEQERFEKISFIDDLIRKKMPVLKRIDIYKLFSARYPTESQRQFYRYCEDVEKLFGSVNIKEKEYQKSIYIEWLEQVASLAMKSGDYKSVINAIKESSLLQKLYDKEDLQALANAEPRTYLIGLNINLPEGKQQRIINLEELEKLTAAESNQLAENIESIEYSIFEMEKDLTKNK